MDVLAEEYQSPFHPQNIIFLEKHETVLDALRTLSDNHILSAPVYDFKTNLFEGVIDILDLVTFVTQKMKNTITLKQPELQQSVIDEMLKQTVETIMNVSERNFWMTVNEFTPLSVVLDRMGEKDLHRILVMDSTGQKVKAVLTQSAVVRWLRYNLEKLTVDPVLLQEQKIEGEKAKEEREKYAANLPFVEDCATKNVKTFKNTDLALDAFNAMYDCKVSAFPIVDERGQLCATLSASDLKGILAQPEKIWDLMNSPIGDFVIRSKSVGYTCYGEERRLNLHWTCKMNDPIFTTIDKLTLSGVHRLWVVDDQNKPIGVVSLCNIIKALSPP